MSKTEITDEQRKRIEENRRRALEKLKLKYPNSIPSNRFSPYERLTKQNNEVKSQQQNFQSSPKPSNTSTTCTIELLDENRFIVRMSYDQKVIEEFKKINSRIFHQTSKNWSFVYEDYKMIVDILMKFDIKITRPPDFVMKQMIRKEESINEECLDQIEETLANSLLGFQRTGVCFAIKKHGRCFIADDMGLGKTRQALAIAEFYKQDLPLLIVTNASTRNEWLKEIQNTLPNIPFNQIFVIEGNKNFFRQEKIIISSYHTLDGNLEELQNKEFGIVIFDESHNIKNPKAKQTMHAKTISQKAKRVIMLTGSPALSRPVELFPQLEILDKTFATFKQFTERYCDAKQTHFGYNANGASNLDELKILLKKTFMIRRIKSDVMLELGDKDRELVILENFNISKEDFIETQEYYSQYNNAKKNRSAEDILLSWYQDTAKIKAYAACKFIENFLKQSKEKVIVFAQHQIILDSLTELVKKMHISYVRIDGSVIASERAARIDCFQNDFQVRIAILSIRACNAGITLTAASTVIFSELDWNPSSIIQAEGRAHRIGQENIVKVYFLLAPQTADDVIWKLLQEKQKKLCKAGLMASSDQLWENLSTSHFNIENISLWNDKKFNSKSQGNSNSYFNDDDEDEEFLKYCESLP